MSSRHVKPIIKFAGYVIILFCGISVLWFFYQSIRNHNFSDGNDLSSYIRSAKLFFEGGNPYVARFRGFIYPLFLLIVSFPFSFLQSNYFQKAITAGIWAFVAYFAFFKTILISWRYLGDNRNTLTLIRDNVSKLAFLVLLLHPFLQDEFLNGQVNLFMVGSVAAYFFMLEKKQELAAALFLAIAASLKITPAIFLVLVLLTRQYRVIPYFVTFVALFDFALPLLINNQSLNYYRYFITEIMPQLTAHEFKSGFRSYSIISTAGYLLGIHWTPLLRITAIGSLATALLLPALLTFIKSPIKSNHALRLTFLASIFTIIPLIFPMAETHHLLILTVPLILILEHFGKNLSDYAAIFRDKLSVWFMIFLTILHLGHAFKPTPLRLIGLLGIYFGVQLLLKKAAQPPKNIN